MAEEFEKTTFAEEFPEGTAPMDTEAPIEAGEAKERETYTLNDGSQGSRAAFIREKFLQDNMSRKDIAEQFGFAYRVVYSATVNMVNSAEAPQRGRGVSSNTIKLTAVGAVVLEKDGKIFLNGEEQEPGFEVGETKEVNRNEWIKEQVATGVSRGDIAKYLDMSYGVIYGITKDQEGTRQRVEIELDDGTKVSRAEYIRMKVAAGASKSDVAKELGVPYSVVWQATKTEKADADQLAEFIDEFSKFQDKVTDANLFEQIVNAMKTLQIKEPETAEEAVTE